MEKLCRGSGRRLTANLISSQVHPKNLSKVQCDASFCLQGTYRAVWSLLLAFFCQIGCKNHLLPFSPAAIARSTQGSGQAFSAASQGATGTSTALTGKDTKLGSGSSRDFLSLVLGKAGGGQHKENRLSCGVSARRRIQIPQLGNFPSETPCKMQSALALSDSSLRKGSVPK